MDITHAPIKERKSVEPTTITQKNAMCFVKQKLPQMLRIRATRTLVLRCAMVTGITITVMYIARARYRTRAIIELERRFVMRTGIRTTVASIVRVITQPQVSKYPNTLRSTSIIRVTLWTLRCSGLHKVLRVKIDPKLFRTIVYF